MLIHDFFFSCTLRKCKKKLTIIVKIEQLLFQVFVFWTIIVHLWTISLEYVNKKKELREMLFAELYLAMATFSSSIQWHLIFHLWKVRCRHYVQHSVNFCVQKEGIWIVHIKLCFNMYVNYLSNPYIWHGRQWKAETIKTFSKYPAWLYVGVVDERIDIWIDFAFATDKQFCLW